MAGSLKGSLGNVGGLLKGSGSNGVIISLMRWEPWLVQRFMMEIRVTIRMVRRSICRGATGFVLVCIGGRVTVTIVRHG